MRKIITLLLFVCMLSTSVPVALADGEGDGAYVIRTYEELVEWKNNGYLPDVFCLAPSGDFGWPQTETVLDFTGLLVSKGLSMYSSSWTIPENVTIKNLSLGLDSKSSIIINGKWYNDYYQLNGYPCHNNLSVDGSITLGKNAVVTGEVRLYCESTLVANDAYVEEIYVANFNSSSEKEKRACIYGTLKTSKITMHRMDLYLMENSDLTIESTYNNHITGTNETTFYINNGAEVTLLSKNGGIYLSSNIYIRSGGKLNTLANFPNPECTLTIEEGGEVKAYEGFRIDADDKNAAIRGKGTIKLFGWGYPFRYVNGDERINCVTNPGNIPMVDSTIIIKSMDECDHAGGKAIMCLPDYTDREQKTHVVRCFCCWEEVEGTKELHKYVMTEDYDWGTRYECACGSYEYVNKSSGSCGEDVNFSLAYNELTIAGSGETSEFSAEDAPWASEAENIKEIKIGDNVTGIGANAFDGCTALEKVTISSDVTKIDASAFASCDSLEKVEYDGTYEQWKSIDVKEGNDAFLYTEIVFNDDSKLLAPTNEYSGKTDVLFKTSESQETTSLELCIIPDENKITQEELKDAVVYVAVYDENGKMENLESLTKSKAENRIEFGGNMPTENNFQILIWSKTCFPMTSSVTGN